MEKEWYQARAAGKSTPVLAMAAGLRASDPLSRLPEAPTRPPEVSQRSREESERRLLEASEKRKRRRQKRLQQMRKQ